MKKIKIKVQDAIGQVLCHDITKIIPGEFKGAAFKKGHIIKKEDIKKLLDLGKENLWVLKIGRDEFHEDEAAQKFKRLAGWNVKTEGPSEGKVNFLAKRDGLLVVEKEIVKKINGVNDIVFATLHSFTPVKKGAKIAGIRIVPLATKKSNVWKVLQFVQNRKPLKIFPFKKKKVGLIVTGSEVAKGRIEDKFKPIIENKIKSYGSVLGYFKITDDNKNLIKKEILKANKHCDLIILTGGMSVDPDDETRFAIKHAGAKIISYSAPVLPGNMLLVAELNGKPVFGVPACALYSKTTSFDLFLLVAMADIKITRENVLERGYGGFCMNCKVCRWPSCSFGK
ncbi:MAG: molybdopterin-binding protein [Elusimicrobia bacterium]|nr:molybdopterin-binding protein [Elusimicrobiota bacterium]